jgi:hypothetical protein
LPTWQRQIAGYPHQCALKAAQARPKTLLLGHGMVFQLLSALEKSGREANWLSAVKSTMSSPQALDTTNSHRDSLMQSRMPWIFSHLLKFWRGWLSCIAEPLAQSTATQPHLSRCNLRHDAPCRPHIHIRNDFIQMRPSKQKRSGTAVRQQ